MHMKKLLMLGVISFMVFSDCKKNNSESPGNHLTTVGAAIIGKWYVKSFVVEYLVNSTQDIFDDIIPNVNSREFPTYHFYQNNVILYHDPSDTTEYNEPYAIKSNNGIDSLIISGDVPLNVRINSVTNTLLVLTSSKREIQYFHDSIGDIVTTDLTESVLTYSRTQTP